MAGESLAEHATELWIAFVSVLGVSVGLIAMVYKGLIKRIERIENKIPDEMITKGDLSEHCKEMQPKCPKNLLIDQIALDTKAIREDLKKVVSKQETLREQTLPREYLTIDTYDKNHTRLEQTLKESINEIKVILSGKSDVQQIRLVINEKIEELRQLYVRGK